MRSSRLIDTNKILLLLCVMYFLLYVDRVNISTAAPLIQSELGLSNVQLGFAFSAFAYPYAAFQLIGGWLGDRFGPRVTLTISGVIVVAATAATGLATGLAALFAVRFALGLGEGATFPTATRALADGLPKSMWGFAQGITHGSARLGNAATPPLIAFLVSLVSWRGSFLVLAVVTLIWVVAWTRVFRDGPRHTPALPPATARDTRHATPVPWRALFRRMLPVTAVDFCYGWTLWLFLSWIPSLFVRSYHQDLKQSALYSAGVFIGGVVGDTVGGIVSDRILKRTGDLVAARRNVIVTGMLGGFVFLMPVILVHNVHVAAVSLSIAFFFAELVIGPIRAVPMDIAPQHSALASGMMNFGFGVAGIISPVVFGYLVDVTGSWTVPFIGSVALLLLGACLAFRMRPDLPFESPQTSRRSIARDIA